ncbi:MAG TPA: NAD(P)-dependent oxidoreductase [Bacteroidia bacterium]
MKILITGVNGLLGHELAQLMCSDKGNHVYGLSRSEQKVNADNYTHIPCDLNAEDFVTRLPGQVDAVVHLAQSEKFRDFPAASIDVFNVNTLSTLRLLDYARKANSKTFVYASSGGVYGNKDIGFTEDSPILGTGDLGFYLSSKLCSEIIADNYTSFFNVVQLRFFFVFGPRQNKSMLIPRLISSVQNKNEITLSGQEGITINPIYVSDAAMAVKKALALDHSDKINIAGTSNLSLRRIGEIIAAKLGTDPVFRHDTNEPKNLIGDIQKMKKLLFVPEVSFEQGIDNMIKSLKAKSE